MAVVNGVINKYKLIFSAVLVAKPTNNILPSYNNQISTYENHINGEVNILSQEILVAKRSESC